MKKLLESIPEHKLILMLLLLALLLRLPWLYTTIEKDEGQFGYTAWRWLSGEKLYIDLEDNKPPLLYMTYALPILLFGNSIIPIRLLNDLLFLISIIFFFKLTKNLFSKKIALFSTLFYATFMNIPVFEGYLAMSESLLTPFFIMSVYFFERYASAKKTYLLFTSSIFASISLLIKQQAIFIFFILISGLFIYKEKNKLKHAVLIVTVPAVAIFTTHFLDGQLFLNFFQRTWGEITRSPMGLASGYMPYEYNLLIIIEGSLLLLFSIVGLVKTLRSKKTEKDKFMISWLVFAALFTLIPPAYGHYYIFLIPPLAIFAGIGTAYSIKIHQNKKIFIGLVVLLFFTTCFLLIKHYPNSTMSFGQITWGWSDFGSYDQQMGLVSFIKNMTRQEDKVFIIGWDPTIYWLSERHPPFDSLAYSLQYPVNMSRLEYVMKKENLTYVLFLDEYEEFDKQFEFLSNPRIVYGVKVYEIKTKEDWCYWRLAYKKRDIDFCKLISTPFLKQYCYALLNLNFYGCYNIIDPITRNECFTLIATEKKDFNICDKIKGEYFFDYCMAKTRGEFNYTACIDSLNLKHKNKDNNPLCIKYCAEFKNDINLCDFINNPDQKFFCKETVTSNKAYCGNISDKYIYNLCMADATSNSSYCEENFRNF